MKLTDIHIHVIPNVDDGAKNITDSIGMLESAYNQGVREIIATPHDFAFLDNKKKVLLNYSTLKCLFTKINIHLGCEIYCEPMIMKNILYYLNNRIYPSINNTKYVLVEFNVYEIYFENIKYCVKELVNNGWIPIIAHIERYFFTTENRVVELKKMGCVIQANICSISSETYLPVKKCTIEMLDKQLIDVLGSDAHGLNYRPPKVEENLKYLKEHYDSKYIEKITSGNAKQYFNL